MFEIATGTVTGTDHIFSRKNNQDAYYLIQRPELIVGVVCDGCGDPTSPHSEVGAQIAAQTIARLLAQFEDPPFGSDVMDEDLDYVEDTLQGSLEILAASMSGGWGPEDTKKIVRDYLLFTIQAVVINPTWAVFLGIGDGTLYVNEEHIPLGPFPDNTPPYFSYRLLGSSLLTSDPGSLKFQVHYQTLTQNLNHFLIGSDGVGEIQRRQAELMPNQKEYLGGVSQFWTNDKYFTNPQAVNRRLALANATHQQIDWIGRNVVKHTGLLRDDTTLITGRSKDWRQD